MNRAALITNRTQADIDFVISLVAQNLPLPLGNMRISWDWRTLNRIESCTADLYTLLTALGYDTPIASLKTNWNTQDLNSEVEGNRVLNNLRTVRKIFENVPGMPAVPNSPSDLTFQQANDIEQILFNIDVLLENMQSIFRRAGTIRAGQVKLRAKRS